MAQNLTQPEAGSASAGEAREGKYLTFSLAQEEYGIGIIRIKEIIGLMPVTSLPQSPYFVKGVINLRGKVIPVTDLRLKFGLPEGEATDKTCIIVVEIGSNRRRIQMGIVVDSVSEVINIKASEIEDTPSFGSAVETDYILGMAKAEGRVKILLDIDRVMGTDGIAEMEAMEASSPEYAGDGTTIN